VGAVLVGGFLVYHFTVHTVKNQRPVGAANVDVSRDVKDQTEASFVIDPSRPRLLYGATNDAGGEVVPVYTSANGGRTWRRTDGPPVAGGSCANGEARTAIDRSGRQYLAFLAGQYCGDNLTPYLVVTSRASSTDRWGPLVRVVPQAWKFGFDDAPSLAVDERSGRLYLSWLRSLAAKQAVLVVSTSADRGRTWTKPAVVSDTLDHPHLVTLTVASDGAVYLAGIDAKLGVWVARSTDAGRTFGTPRSVARLVANPAGGCALTGDSPLPKEHNTCVGPNPTLSVTGDRVYVVYGDIGANESQDVFVSAFDRALQPLFRGRVNPPDSGKADQFFPASGADPTTDVLWACWYDTTFDPDKKRAWFTCSASKNGRTWGAPVRAAEQPTEPGVLYAVTGQQGLQPEVVARDGRAHAFWTDGRIIANESDVFTAAIPQQVALTPPS
jgi:hypothetical protein